MATFTKLNLSGSTDGQPIAITATATPGTLIHTADSTALDEIWLYATVRDNQTLLTLEYGGVTDGDQIRNSLNLDTGLILVVPGLILTNSLILRAFVDNASDINLVGFVNRIS